MRLSLFLCCLLLCIGTSAQTNKAPFDYQVETLFSGLAHPWSLAFLPNEDILITERSGQLQLLSKDGKLQQIQGLPDDIYFAGQGGLLDIKLHPNYANNGWLYLTYAAGNAKANATTLVRAKLEKHSLTKLEKLFSVSPTKSTPVHYGGRLTFLPDNSLLLTSGDGFDYREDAQRVSNQLGKMIRLNDDGSIPQNNPYIGETEKNLAHAVFSIGHRNPQAILYDERRQVIFAHEHGPAGGDEINIIQPGNNYGWPVITNGRDYSGASISPYKSYPGMQQPFADWTPSIAPSDMILYRGKMFPELRGDLLVSTLKSKEVRWVQFDGNRVKGQQSLFTELKSRIRGIHQHPEGSLYILTDGDDAKLLRVFR